MSEQTKSNRYCITPGSTVSEGTLRPYDLLSALSRELHSLSTSEHHSWALFYHEAVDFITRPDDDSFNHDTAQCNGEAVDDAIDRINDLVSADGLYLGTLEGNGACICYQLLESDDDNNE